MGKIFFTSLGAIAIVIVSFWVTLKAIDHFELFLPPGPRVALSVNGKDSIEISSETYRVSYSSSGAQSCEIKYHNSLDGSSGVNSVAANTASTASSGMIGNYTLTCIGTDGRSTSKTVQINRRSSN
jgi:hypothetical protein